MATVILSPEARELYNQTVARGARLSYFGIEWSSEAEAEQEITNTFYAAAGVNEFCCGDEIGETRYLDLSEARLAIAALNLSGGNERLLSAGEARAARDGLNAVVGTLAGARSSGQSYAEYLMNQAAERGQGWRHLRDESVRRDIRASFRSSIATTSLDDRPGMDPVDAVFAAFSFNYEAGGSDSDIDYDDAWIASARISSTLEGLKTYYSS